MNELEMALREMFWHVANMSYALGYNDALDLDDMATELVERDAIIEHHVNSLKNMILSGGTRATDA